MIKLKNIEIAQEAQGLIHRLQISAFGMFNARKRAMSEEEVLKMLDIQETLEELLLRVNDGSFEIRKGKI